MHVKVVVVEASSAAMLPVAKQALQLLWEETLKSPKGAQDKPGNDAVIARNLIRLTTEMSENYNLERGRCRPGQTLCRSFNNVCSLSLFLISPSSHPFSLLPLGSGVCSAKHRLENLEGCLNVPAGKEEHAPAAPGAAGDSVQCGSAKESIHQELAGLFSQAHDRLEAVGAATFFGLPHLLLCCTRAALKQLVQMSMLTNLTCALHSASQDMSASGIPMRCWAAAPHVHARLLTAEAFATQNRLAVLVRTGVLQRRTGGHGREGCGGGGSAVQSQR